MESALFCDFLGNFSTRGEKYYFHVEGSMRGVHKVRLLVEGVALKLGDFVWWRGRFDPKKSPCIHARWECQTCLAWARGDFEWCKGHFDPTNSPRVELFFSGKKALLCITIPLCLVLTERSKVFKLVM